MKFLKLLLMASLHKITLKIKNLFLLITIILFSYMSLLIADTNALNIKSNNNGITYLVYFTGIGCPHCANVDNLLLNEKIFNKNIIVIEYEIYKQPRNAPLIMNYHSTYSSGLGIPIIIADNQNNKYLFGDKEIIKDIDAYIAQNNGNLLLMPNGKLDFSNSDISKIPGLPKIWYRDRVAIKTNINSMENNNIRQFILTKNLPPDAKKTNEVSVSLSGSQISFDNGIEMNGWKLLYNND